MLILNTIYASATVTDLGPSKCSEEVPLGFGDSNQPEVWILRNAADGKIDRQGVLCRDHTSAELLSLLLPVHDKDQL